MGAKLSPDTWTLPEPFSASLKVLQSKRFLVGQERKMLYLICDDNTIIRHFHYGVNQTAAEQVSVDPRTGPEFR